MSQFTYSPWRHGGWYVDNVRYPSGAVGCVSRNYPDKKWRIVCDPRGDEAPTFTNRDAAAAAELELTKIRAAAPCDCPPPPANVEPRYHHLYQSDDCPRHGYSRRSWDRATGDLIYVVRGEEWWRDDDAFAALEGWAIFHADGGATPGLHIERIDTQETPGGVQLQSDPQAWRRVWNGARAGSRVHRRALRLIFVANRPEYDLLVAWCQQHDPREDA